VECHIGFSTFPIVLGYDRRVLEEDAAVPGTVITFYAEDGRTSLANGDSLVGVGRQRVVVAARADFHDVAVVF